METLEQLVLQDLELQVLLEQTETEVARPCRQTRLEVCKSTVSNALCLYLFTICKIQVANPIKEILISLQKLEPSLLMELELLKRMLKEMLPQLFWTNSKLWDLRLPLLLDLEQTVVAISVRLMRK